MGGYVRETGWLKVRERMGGYVRENGVAKNERWVAK
jgi:hypothetical protein